MKAKVGPLLSVFDSHVVSAHTPFSLSLFVRGVNETGKRLSSAKHAAGPLIDLDFLPCTQLINEMFNVTP